MQPGDMQAVLTARLTREGRALQHVTPTEGIEEVLRFYEEIRADGCDLDGDGDMLLYQWGVYAWSGPEAFELDITRQFVLPDDDEPYQLSLTFNFDPEPELRELGDGNEWCYRPEVLPAFRQFIQLSKPYAALGNRLSRAVELTYEQQ